MSEEERQSVIKRTPEGMEWLRDELLADPQIGYEQALGALCQALKDKEEMRPERLLIRQFVTKFSAN